MHLELKMGCKVYKSKNGMNKTVFSSIRISRFTNPKWKLYFKILAIGVKGIHIHNAKEHTLAKWNLKIVLFRC